MSQPWDEGCGFSVWRWCGSLSVARKSRNFHGFAKLSTIAGVRSQESGVKPSCRGSFIIN
ncbi:hypothetical protein [Trichormus sp. NMC-1]|uniref:hypothetical protein n=1 Tax=Trichormus sp. NMC-1 TaxID=1853259 RepID=UPI0015A6DA78|nr:hypothetical protein [Trichormus sp. NMC-1]